MLQQGGQDLTVCVVVPLVRVVLELDIVRLGLSLLAVDDGPVLHTKGTTGHLVRITTAEGLVVEGQRTTGLEPLLIELLQFGKVEFAHQITRGVLPLADLLLIGCLLADQPDAVDTLVHADGVLPVVRTVGILRVILDAYSLRSPHMTDHDILLYFTGLIHRLVHRIPTLLDAITRQITARAAGIADSH